MCLAATAAEARGYTPVLVPSTHVVGLGTPVLKDLDRVCMRFAIDLIVDPDPIFSKFSYTLMCDRWFDPGFETIFDGSHW